MKYEDLKKFRAECNELTLDDFINFWESNGCDESYARENWASFQDGPMLYITWHSYGQDLFEFIKKLKGETK